MKKIAIVATSFHEKSMKLMVNDAQKTAHDENLKVLVVVWVPGCYEVPLALKRLLTKKDIDGAIILGIIEKGETKHGLVMGTVVHDAIVRIELETGKPVGLGILGPEILLKQVPSRAKLYARKSVLALKAMFDLTF